MLSVECVPHKNSKLIQSRSTVLLNRLILKNCYNVILYKSVFICFMGIESFYKSDYPSKYFDSSCNGVTIFSPLERHESSSNIYGLLCLLITVIHLFKARVRQTAFINLCKVIRPFKNLGVMSWKIQCFFT